MTVTNHTYVYSSMYVVDTYMWLESLKEESLDIQRKYPQNDGKYICVM